MTLDLYGHRDEDLGTEVRYSVSNLAAAQARMGDRPVIHLLTSGRSRRSTAQGVEVVWHRCLQPRNPHITKRFARQLSLGMLRAIRRSDTDLVHFHGTRQLHPMYAAIAWRTKRQRLPLVAQDRGNREVGRVETWAQRQGVERSDLLLAASQDTIGVMQELGAPESSIDMLSNGYDPELFFPGEQEPPAGGEPFRILSVSRLNEDKDPLTMARAMAELVRRGRDIHVTVVSRGALRDAVEAELRAGDVPTTFIEHVPQRELGELYRTHHAYVLTSLREGFNQTVLESMASGLPIVATDIPGTADAGADAAQLVPVQRPDAVADALERLIADEGEWRRYREAGLERARCFTWDAVAERLRDLYLRVV
jgi:glycosyltransferase involved in cell wall biosynthesis